MRMVPKNDLPSRCRWWFLTFFIYFIVFGTVFLFWRPTPIVTWHSELTLNRKALYPYIAMIVDDRAIPAVIQAVNNVLEHIPNDWNVQIIAPYQNWPFYKNSSLAQLIRDDRVILTSLDVQRGNLSNTDFANLVLTSSSFWRQVLGDKVLLFQTDSVLCSNSAYNLTDFLQYDFIGAPWKSAGCCNGGLSLRDRTKILFILENGRMRFRIGDINEDRWFAKSLRRFGGHLPSKYIASHFAVETVYHSRPFGVHSPRLGQIVPADMARLCNECPETRTITSHC